MIIIPLSREIYLSVCKGAEFEFLPIVRHRKHEGFFIKGRGI